MITRILNQLDKIRAAGLLIIVFAYTPGVFKESFWSDDYVALMDTQGLANHLLKDGRPTAAVLLSSSFSLIKDPANAWILRALALVTLLSIFLFITKQINGARHRDIGTISIAIAFCLPSFQMYIHWSTTWFYLLAVVAGLYAFHFWSSKLASKKILALVLLVLALTTYPPAALFFFAVIAITNLVNESKCYRFFVDAIQGIILLSISGMVSILVVFFTMEIANFSPNSRVAIVPLSGIPEKIIWLFSRPFVISLRPFMIDSPTVSMALFTSIPMLLILIFGLKQQSNKLGESFLYIGALVAALLLLSLAPIVVTSDNQIEFRVLPGLAWGIAVSATYFLLVMISSWLNPLAVDSKLKRMPLLVATLVLAFVGIGSINAHYVDLFSGPYQKKNTFLTARISSCFDSRSINNIVIIPPKQPFPTLQRLGVFSMSTDLASGWVPKPNVELLLRRINTDVPVEYLATRPLDTKITETECVIDLEEFRELLTHIPPKE